MRLTQFSRPLSRLMAAVVCFAFIAILGACATNPPKARTVAKKDAAYSEKLQRVLLLAPGNAKVGQADVWTAVSEKLKTRGVSVELVLQDPLELERGKALRDAAAKFKPTHLLTLEITQSSKTTTTGGFAGSQIVAGDTYQATIQELLARKTVWRASTNVGYSRIVAGEREGVIATSLIEQLVLDGLL